MPRPLFPVFTSMTSIPDSTSHSDFLRFPGCLTRFPPSGGFFRRQLLAEGKAADVADHVVLHACLSNLLVEDGKTHGAQIDHRLGAACLRVLDVLNPEGLVVLPAG